MSGGGTGGSPGATLTASLGMLALCAAIFTVRYAAPVLLPLVLAILLFYTLDPIVTRLHRWRVPRMLASSLVVLSLVGGVAAGGYAIWPQIEAVVDQVPESVAQLRRDLKLERRASKSTLDRVQEAATAIDAAAADASPAPAKTPGVTRVEVRQSWRPSDWLWISGIGMLGFAGQAVTVLFLTLFLLNEGDSFKRKLVRHVETTGTKRAAVRILDDIQMQMSRFIYVQVATAGAVAGFTGLALWWLGVKQPAVWGLFAGILNVVPYFGPLIVSAVLAAVGLLQFGTFSGMMVVAGVALVITSIEGMILTPHLLSRASSLNHVAIFGAIAFWSWAWGTPGMLLAVPLLMVCKSISDHVEALSGLADFLGNGEAPPRPARARSIAS